MLQGAGVVALSPAVEDVVVGHVHLGADAADGLAVVGWAAYAAAEAVVLDEAVVGAVHVGLALGYALAPGVHGQSGQGDAEAVLRGVGQRLHPSQAGAAAEVVAYGLTAKVHVGLHLSLAPVALRRAVEAEAFDCHHEAAQFLCIGRGDVGRHRLREHVAPHKNEVAGGDDDGVVRLALLPVGRGGVVLADEALLFHAVEGSVYGARAEVGGLHQRVVKHHRAARGEVGMKPQMQIHHDVRRTEGGTNLTGDDSIVHDFTNFFIKTVG